MNKIITISFEDTLITKETLLNFFNDIDEMLTYIQKHQIGKLINEITNSFIFTIVICDFMFDMLIDYLNSINNKYSTIKLIIQEK